MCVLRTEDSCTYVSELMDYGYDSPMTGRDGGRVTQRAGIMDGRLSHGF